MPRLNIDELERIEKSSYHVQEEADAAYSVFESRGKRYFTIDSYGSPNRKFQKRASQVTQLDEENAVKLIRLLVKELKLSWDDILENQ